MLLLCSGFVLPIGDPHDPSYPRAAASAGSLDVDDWVLRRKLLGLPPCPPYHWEDLPTSVKN